jgi:transcription elongation factor Elf1
MKIGVCPKCNTETWLEEHHILPKAVFGKNDKTVLICSNCHTDFHKKVGSKLESKNPDVYWVAYIQWLIGALSVILLIYYYAQ